MRLFDAHNHLHDARLAPFRDAIVPELERVGVAGAMVNGTREEDWAGVEECAARFGWARSSFGLHPWHVAQCGPDWLARLDETLKRQPAAGVGEIGLDRWIEGHDLAAQMQVFNAQMQLAVARDRAVTIHCLKAWGALADYTRANALPGRGFLLHAYGGPVEMVEPFARLGAYFSFSPYFLHPRKQAARDAFRAVPPDRLLVETDAPDLRPPTERDVYQLHDAGSGEPLNHPGNLTIAYEGLAEVRAMPLEDLGGLVEENFHRLFD